MSEVIRDVVIRMHLEAQKAKLEAPQVGPATRAVAEHTKVIKENAKVTAESARVHEDFGRRSFSAMSHAGHGLLQLTRGIALMSASSEEDTRKLLENLIKIEAAVSALKGAASLAKFAASYGRLGAAAAAAGVAVGVGTLIWNRHQNELEAVRKRADDLRRSLELLGREEKARASAMQNRFGDLRIDNAQTETSRFARIEAERARAVEERSKIQEELRGSKLGLELRGETPEERALTLRVHGNVNREELDLQKSLQERLGENASRQRELQSQMFERDKRLNDAARERFSEAQDIAREFTSSPFFPGTGGMAGFGADVGLHFGQASFNQETNRQLANAQQALDGLVKLIQDAAVRAAEIETVKKQLEAAHPN